MSVQVLEAATCIFFVQGKTQGAEQGGSFKEC
jgi:hypothetical protein